MNAQSTLTPRFTDYISDNSTNIYVKLIIVAKSKQRSNHYDFVLKVSPLLAFVIGLLYDINE